MKDEWRSSSIRYILLRCYARNGIYLLFGQTRRHLQKKLDVHLLSVWPHERINRIFSHLLLLLSITKCLSQCKRWKTRSVSRAGLINLCPFPFALYQSAEWARGGLRELLQKPAPEMSLQIVHFVSTLPFSFYF